MSYAREVPYEEYSKEELIKALKKQAEWASKYVMDLTHKDLELQKLREDLLKTCHVDDKYDIELIEECIQCSGADKDITADKMLRAKLVLEQMISHIKDLERQQDNLLENINGKDGWRELRKKLISKIDELEIENRMLKEQP